MKHFARFAPSVIVIAALAITATVYRQPLAEWFEPLLAEPNPAGAQAAGLDDVQRASWAGIFTAYEAVRAQLALDDRTAVGPQLQALGAKLSNAKGAKDQQLAAVAALAELSAAGDLEAMREPFGELSRALFGVAALEPRLGAGYQVFMCPMAKGFQHWFQGPETIDNPYMGQRMLFCGSAAKWEDAASTAAPAHDHGQDGDDVAHYTCAMHPSVRQVEPGTCPICNMDLTPVTHDDLRTGAVVVDDARRQAIGIRTTAIGRRRLTRSLRAAGRLVYDEARVEDVTARVDGWVEAVEVKRTGDPVARGQTLLRFYSPELYTTQADLLAAQAEGSSAARIVERLRLAGMASADIGRVQRTRKTLRQVPLRSPLTGFVLKKSVNKGARVRAGALLYRIANTDVLWLEADVPSADLQHLSVGMAAAVTPLGAAARRGKISHINPYLRPGTRTGTVRINLTNADGALRPDGFAEVRFELDLGEHLAVPDEALIMTEGDPIVFVDHGEGRLIPTAVTTGVRGDDAIAILSGLAPGDAVLDRGVFLIAAERRIKAPQQGADDDHAEH